MIFRSLTDMQLALRHDPQPLVHSLTGERSAPLDNPDGDWFLDPRIECIPSREPDPWLNPWLGERADHRRQPHYRWDPRPENARPPVNRVLKAFREGVQRIGDVSMGRYATAYLASLTSMYAAGLYDSAEVEHARKVLTRLTMLNPVVDQKES